MKSFVSLEQHLCLVCLQPHDTEAIVIDRRLRRRLEYKTITGWGLCPEHRRLYEDGYIALVECDPARSGHPEGGSRVDPRNVYRTGRVAHLKRDVFDRVFVASVKPSTPCVFVEPAVLDLLQARTQE